MSPAFGADLAATWGRNATVPVPSGAKVTLETDRREYFLGENVLLHFTLENTGKQPFEASFGGDYRGSTRALRFKVTATDQQRRVAEDPDPNPINYGGFGGPRTLKPGEKFSQSLPLMRHCEIDHAGEYTIRATHDFGWKEGARKRPVGEITLTFRNPTVAEAERIVGDVEKQSADPDATFGQRSQNYRDFTSLRQPIYLVPLRQRAEKGSAQALDSLGRIASREATEALIQLSRASDSKLALEAALTLNKRLPEPEFEKGLPKDNFWRAHTAEIRQRLAARTWDTNFAPSVRSLATNFLARSEPREIACGAFMAEAIGTLAEVPAVIAATDRALNDSRMVTPRRNATDNILNLPEPLPQLLRTMHAMRLRGFRLGENLSGNGQFLIYFASLVNEPLPRPPRWQHIVENFGVGSHYAVNEMAVRSIPEPMPGDCFAYVKGRLADRDLGVCRAACEVAGKSGNREFIKPLLEIIATENHEWLLRSATSAARELGAGFDLFDSCADRLSDEHLYGIALDSLQTVIEGLSNSHTGRTDLTRAERLELRKQWKAFLARHADEIRAGKRFKVGDATVTPALFGRARAWQLADGTVWPSSDQSRKPAE